MAKSHEPEEHKNGSKKRVKVVVTMDMCGIIKRDFSEHLQDKGIDNGLRQT